METTLLKSRLSLRISKTSLIRSSGPRKKLLTTSPKQIKIITGNQPRNFTTIKIVTLKMRRTAWTTQTLCFKLDAQRVNTQPFGEVARIAKKDAADVRDFYGDLLAAAASTHKE